MVTLVRKKMSKRNGIFMSSNPTDKTQGTFTMERKIASFPKKIPDDMPGDVSKTNASHRIDSSRRVFLPLPRPIAVMSQMTHCKYRRDLENQ